LAPHFPVNAYLRYEKLEFSIPGVDVYKKKWSVRFLSLRSTPSREMFSEKHFAELSSENARRPRRTRRREYAIRWNACPLPSREGQMRHGVQKHDEIHCSRSTRTKGTSSLGLDEKGTNSRIVAGFRAADITPGLQTDVELGVFFMSLVVFNRGKGRARQILARSAVL
jgi:hypothetical protein